MLAQNIMSLPTRFYSIEDYTSAHESRFDDFKIFEFEKRKVMAMHIGAIAIECWVKSLIIKKFKLDGSGKCPLDNQYYWYNISSGNRRSNPGHRIKEALICLGFYAHCPADIKQKLKHIYDPLNKNVPSYIDLRYCEEKFISQSDFEKWLNDFSDCNKWIMQQFQINKEDFR